MFKVDLEKCLPYLDGYDLSDAEKWNGSKQYMLLSRVSLIWDSIIQKKTASLEFTKKQRRFLVS